jgi:hypothetical protein
MGYIDLDRFPKSGDTLDLLLRLNSFWTFSFWLLTDVPDPTLTLH